MSFDPSTAITSERLKRLAGPAAKHVDAITPYLADYADEYGITTPLRCAHLMAQLCHESAGFSKMSEDLNYSDPERIARIFRSPFDVDHDGVIDPEEIEIAKKYVRRPEALANRAYANRLGNRDEASGDGWFYRGRGLIQITGRENYRIMGLALPLELTADPGRAAEPRTAVRIALTYWKSRDINKASDLDSVEKVTRLINGGLNGLPERLRLTAEAKRIFGAMTDLIS